MDDYLSKPFTQQALGHTLARWINLPRQNSQSVDDAAPPVTAENTPPRPCRSTGSSIQRAGAGAHPRAQSAAWRCAAGKILQTICAIRRPAAGAGASLAAARPRSPAHAGAQPQIRQRHVGAVAASSKQLEQLARQQAAPAPPPAGHHRTAFQAARQALEAILEKET
jgi:hypothetical protein